MSRDDFDRKVAEQIARRAAYTCSNPGCRRRTLIPEVSSQTLAIYNGVASHITAASPGGPRYDPSLTHEQRASIENAIHLCRLCANQIDVNGGVDYPAYMLRQWKLSHEVWLREQQSRDADVRREYSKQLSPYFTHDTIYDFVPDERASGYIILPEESSCIPSRHTNVVGRIDKTVERSTFWLAVSPQGSLDSWWPQSLCVLSPEGFWVIEGVVLGRGYPDGKQDLGRTFDIGLYETTTEAHGVFQAAANGGLGIQKPKGAFLLWRVAVLRTA